MPLTTGPHLSTPLGAFTVAAIPGSSNQLHRSPFRASCRSLPPLPSPTQFQSCAQQPGGGNQALDNPYRHVITNNRRMTGRGAVWLARLNGVQEVAGSNPVAPTSQGQSGQQ